MRAPPLDLAEGMLLCGLTHDELWVRYFALGGNDTSKQLRGHLAAGTGACLDDHDHNIIAQALNETFAEHGLDHPVGYRSLYRRCDDDDH